MSIDLKIHQKLDLSLPEPPPTPPDPDEATPEMIKEYKKKKQEFMMEQKYKVDVIDALGASTNDKKGVPFNFLTINNYIIYNVGRHIIIKDCPPDEEEIYSEKEMNKQSNSFFIYISPDSKKITSMQVSLDRNNFVIGEEIEEEKGINYSSISIYSMDNLDIETFYLITPVRKIMTNKFYNFKSINFSEDNKLICTICNEKKSQKSFGIIYDISEQQKFELNLTEPFIVIDLLKENINNNVYLNSDMNFTFNKISFDRNNIICVSGDNNINFWYIYNTVIGKIPLIMNKNYNFIDHTFYQFRNEQKSKDRDNLKKNSVLIAITSSNELYIFQSTQKALDTNDDYDYTEEMNVLSSHSGIEQFIVKFHIDDIFNNALCQSEKICSINNNFFSGLIIGNNYGDIVIYEKTKKDDVNNFDYVLLKKFEKKDNKSKCTCISTNFNGTLGLVSYEKKEASFINFNNLINSIKMNSQEITLPILNGGFHPYSLTTFDISIQRPILVTSSFSDNKIKIWNFLSGYSEYCKVILPQGQKNLEEKFVILAFALHPNGYNIVISNEEMLWFFLICHKEIRFYGNEISEISGNNDNQKRIILQKRNNCYLIKFLNGGNKFIAVNSSKNIFIIETFSREVKTCFHLNHQGKINDVLFSEDNSYLYTFGSDGYIYEVNTITEEAERIISEIITYTQGFMFTSFETKNIIIDEETNKTESRIQKIHNIIACGYDIKESYSLTEIIYIPQSLNQDQKEIKDLVVISSDMTYLKEQITSLIIIFPKKLEKKCIICGTKEGKIVIYPYPVKDAKNKLDEIYTHSGKITKLNYIKEINMLISCGEDGIFFIYSLFEIFGETVLYEKNFENIFRLNTALDVSLGSSFLFPVSELEKIELNKNEEKEMMSKFAEEKEKIEYEQKNNKKKKIEETEKKMNEEKLYLEKIVQEMEVKMKLNKDNLKKELDQKNNELITTLKNDIKNNCNKLYDYQVEIKNLKEKIKQNKIKYKNDIDQKKRDYKAKFREIKKGFNDEILSLLQKQKELKEKCRNEKKDKMAFINNIEKESYLEERMRAKEQFERMEDFEQNSLSLNYEIIKYKDIVEKLEKKIKEKKEQTGELNKQAKYLEKRLDELRKNNSTLTYQKEKVVEEFKHLQYKLQEDDTQYEYKKKLRINLYRQKYELTSKYKGVAINNNIEETNNKSLSKNIINITNKVFSSVKDKNKALSKMDIIKRDNDRLRTEVNIGHQKLDKIIHKIFRSFQTNNRNEVVKCLCEIYKDYVNEDFLKKREKKLLDKKVILELENQINTLEEQISINKSQIKEMNEQHELYKEEKIKENSVLLNRFTNDKNRSQSLERKVESLETQSRILNNEISRIKNNSSSLITSNNASKELRKNVSTIDVLPKINFYKYKNTSTVLPSSIIKADNEENSASKKGSFFSKSNNSKIQNSDGPSEHISFID